MKTSDHQCHLKRTAPLPTLSGALGGTADSGAEITEFGGSPEVHRAFRPLEAQLKSSGPRHPPGPPQQALSSGACNVPPTRSGPVY